jgi:hypothetical protein
MAGPADEDGRSSWAPVDPGAPASPSSSPPPAAGPPPGYGQYPYQYQYGWGPPPAPMPKGGSVRTGPLPLHPMTVGDILDGAFKLMKANAKALFTIVAVFTVPLQLIAAFSQRNALGGAGFFDVLNDPSVAEAASEQGQSGADIALQLLATLANIVVLPFLAGAISLVVGASYLGQELSAGEALRRTFRRFWALFASWVLVHLLEVSGFVLAILLAVGIGLAADSGVVGVLVGVVGVLAGIPVLLAVMALSVMVAPAIVVEELGPVRGIRRSWSLGRRRFWAVLGIALLAGLLSTVIGSTLGFLPQIAALIVGLEWGWLLLALGAILTALVTQPIVAIVATLQYFDARIRFEGFDLQVIATELAAPGAPR